MDLFGKILVLANFALSLMMAAIGGAVLFYRVDWSDAPTDAATGAPPGELVARIAKVKELQALVTPADAYWRETRASLLAQEERRKGDEIWYAAELEHLKTGDASKKPILALVFDKGVTTPDPANNGRPQMAPVADRFGTPLRSLVWYNQQQGAVNADTTTVLDKIDKASQEDKTLTSLLLTEKQADGSILGTPDQSAAGRAGAANLPIWPSLANDSTNPSATDQLLNSPHATNVLVNEMVAAIRYDGYRGINLDFEGMLGTDKAAFTAFVQQLATALHSHGAKLIVDVVPHDFAGVNMYSAAYDIAAIGKVADFVDLMAYDEHGNGGTPGPVAGLDWDNSILQATLPDLTPAHVLLGVPLYGRAWGSLGGAAAYSNVLYNALSVPGARVDYDFSAQTPYILSPDGSLTTYFDDADSLARKVALVHAYGLGGIAAWRLGFEDQGFWSLFRA